MQHRKLRTEEQNVNDTNNIIRHSSTIGADLLHFILYSSQSWMLSQTDKEMGIEVNMEVHSVI